MSSSTSSSSSEMQPCHSSTALFEVHSLPFHIEHDGSCPVSKYFLVGGGVESGDGKNILSKNNGNDVVKKESSSGEESETAAPEMKKAVDQVVVVEEGTSTKKVDHDSSLPSSKQAASSIISCTTSTSSAKEQMPTSSASSTEVISTFRGRELKGEQMDVASDGKMKAYVLKKNDSQTQIGHQTQSQGNWQIEGKVGSLTFWNSGRAVAETDELPQLLQWMNTIAPAIHG
ncbi:unnamed protein product [Amoebophrya sp. A25]|nr:unnamed protein product [Amoebophrya sp. A25]|eukprot:GSA25T00024953001.1